MARIKLNLQDRNLLILGGSSHFLASVISQLTEEGANVFVADKSTKHLANFAENLNSQREIHPEYGRCFVWDFDWEKEDDHKLVLQKASEFMGGSDAVILWQENLHAIDLTQTNSKESTDKLTESFKSRFSFLQTACEFLNTRRNACFIQIFNESRARPLKNFELSSAIENAKYHMVKNFGLSPWAEKIRFHNLSIGPTEDFLLQWQSDKKVHEALDLYKEIFPKAELLNSSELSRGLSFLIGNNSSYPKLHEMNLGVSPIA